MFRQTTLTGYTNHACARLPRTRPGGEEISPGVQMRAARFMSLFEDEGCRMVRMTCERHDQLGDQLDEPLAAAALLEVPF